jgi:hypothetical protein
MPAISEIDRRAFGGDRSFFLERRLGLAPELAWLKVSDGRIAGYVFGRRLPDLAWAGPWWADPDDPDPGPLLAAFAAGAGTPEVRLGVLGSNSRALTLAAALGFVSGPRPSYRMVFGASGSPGIDPALLAVGTAAKG